MKKYCLFLCLIPFYLFAQSQSDNYEDYFPAHSRQDLWSEALEMKASGIARKECADSIVNIALQRMQMGEEPPANLMVTALLADYMGRTCQDIVLGEDILERSRNLFVIHADTVNIAWAYHHSMVGQNYVLKRDAKGLLQAFKRTYHTLQAIDTQHPLIPGAQYRLMQASFLLRDISGGFEYFDPLLHHARQNEDYYYMTTAYLGAGNIIKFYNAGLGSQFLNFSWHLAETHNVTRHLEDPFFYISLGSANTATNQHEKAMELYTRGLEVLQNSGVHNEQLKSSFYYYLGTTYRHLGNYERSIAWLDSAAVLERKISGLTDEYYRSLNLKGKSLNRAQRFDEAIPLNEEVMHYYMQTKGSSDTYFTQQAISELAVSYAGVKRYNDALATLQKAVYFFLQLEVPDNVYQLPDFAHHISTGKNYMELEYALYRKIEIMKDMYMHNPQMSLPQHILSHFEGAMQITDIHASVGQNLETLNSLSSRFKLYSNKLLDMLVEMDLPQHYMKEAYGMVAKSKSYLLLAENLQNKSFRSQNTSTASMENEKANLNNRLLSLSASSNPQQYEKTMARLLEIEKDLFLHHMENPVKTNEILVPQLALTRVSDIHENIAENEMVLDFFVTDSSLHTVIITAGGFRINSQVLPDDFANLARDMFRDIKSGNNQQLLVSAPKIRDFLFEGVSLDEIEHLIIVPDEKLHTIPFELLIMNEPNIAQEMAVSYRYSSPLFRSSANSHPPSLSSFLAIAPVFDQNHLALATDAFRSFGQEEENKDIFRDHQHLAALPATLDEVSAISELFRQRQAKTKTLLRAEASKSNFTKHADQYNILHIATHGFADMQSPERSGLVLHQDAMENPEDGGLLQLGEISYLNIEADLVVLSACKSGYGAIQRGEGIMGISRGFIAAGANNVIASLWKVHDEKTGAFMLTFYSFLLEGNTYHDALRLTKADKIIKGWMPLDWAGFVLIGQ